VFFQGFEADSHGSTFIFLSIYFSTEPKIFSHQKKLSFVLSFVPYQNKYNSGVYLNYRRKRRTCASAEAAQSL
jgi:hypothetical protein